MCNGSYKQKKKYIEYDTESIISEYDINEILNSNGTLNTNQTIEETPINSQE